MRRLACGAIRLYQCAVSPFKPPCCRFLPSCSTYGIEAIGRHGVFGGGLLTLWRLARCHPFGGSGYDPVPETLPWLRGAAASAPREETKA